MYNVIACHVYDMYGLVVCAMDFIWQIKVSICHEWIRQKCFFHNTYTQKRFRSGYVQQQKKRKKRKNKQKVGEKSMEQFNDGKKKDMLN